MKNFLKTGIIILLVFIFAGNGITQTADEIAENYAKKIGGSDKWMSLSSLKFTGKVSNGNNELPMVMIMKRGGMARSEVSYQGMKLITACDMSTGWTVNPFQASKEPEKLPYEEFKEIKKYAELEGELINYKEKGYKLEYLGIDDFEGSEVYKLKLTDKEGDKTYYFIDKSTDLLLMKNSKSKVKEKEKKVTTIYGNYQTINGLMFPMAIQILEGNQTLGQVITLEKVEENVSVDDNIFKMP